MAEPIITFLNRGDTVINFTLNHILPIILNYTGMTSYFNYFNTMTIFNM